MEEPDDFKPLSDEAIALTDAIKAVLEVLIAARIATPSALDQIFGQMRDDKLAKACVPGASIMEILRQFVTDEGRATQREALRMLLQERPRGTA